MDERLSRRHVVLLGIGHTNAHVLRMWAMNPIADTDLTCISPYSVSTYSGFLPAVLAGQKTEQEMYIDLPPLCAAAGARLITDPVTGLDPARNELLFAKRPPVPFDALAIGIGSVPSENGVTVQGESMVMIKPMTTLPWRLGSAVKRAERKPLRVAIVGGGVAGVEITFCVPNFLKRLGCDAFEISLVTASHEVAPEVAEKTRQTILQELERRGVQLVTACRVTRIAEDQITLDDGAILASDVVIWSTGASAPPLLSQLGLPLDDRGFLATDTTLQSTSGRPIFAVGDTGSIVGQSLPKAGVYAVRQGPVLWENIRRCLDGRSLQQYRPQQSFLKLINKGDGTAIGHWKGLSFEGKWVYALKDRIDSRFMEKFRPKPMMGAGEEMQCRGCGCKLGAGDLQTALSDLGDIQLEDAAQIADSDLVASTDFFTSPFRDPYLVGRVAALHSASDVICSGGQVTTALANVVLPEGDPASQKRTLSEFLDGARREFDAMGGKLVGGHTIVGPRMEVGFTVIGKPLGESLIRKSNLKVGDQLYLTKSLGIGVVLAAHMRSMASAMAYDCLLEHMLERQHAIIPLAIDCGVTAGTDVTGFGLAGHLIEMLQASNISARIALLPIPIVIGADDYVQAGVESSLAPANRRFEQFIDASAEARKLPHFQLLFDPQTCGGFLLAVPVENAEQFERAIKELDVQRPVRIGEVTESEGDNRLIVAARFESA